MPNLSLYSEPTGITHSLELPLTSKVDPEFIREDLHLTPHLDLGNSTVRRAIVTIWGARNAYTALGEDARKKRIDGPIHPKLFGGAAIKLLCKSANQEGSPFNRKIHDLDFAVTKKYGPKFLFALCSLSVMAGTQYHYFLTDSDSTFNALRGGSRYRIRAVEGVEGNKPVISTADVFADRIVMRHVIELNGDLTNVDNLTISPESLLLSKAQSIMDISAESGNAIEAADQKFRVLRYKPYPSNRIIMGMEAKDFLDSCCLLLESQYPGSPYGIDGGRLAKIVKGNQKLLLTLRLNLENILVQSDWLRQKGVSVSQVEVINVGITQLLHTLPSVEKSWSKPWWNTDVA